MREIHLENHGWLKYGQVGPYEDWRKGCVVVLDAPMLPRPDNMHDAVMRRVILLRGQVARPGELVAQINEVFDCALPA